MSGPDLPQQMAEALLEMSRMLQPVDEAVDGYRADAERRGYSPTVAEQMALQFHTYLLAQLMAGVKRP